MHRDPTFDAVVRMEVREKKGCGVCVRRIQIFTAEHGRDQFVCAENKRFPFCRGDKKGFEYDLGD